MRNPALLAPILLVAACNASSGAASDSASDTRAFPVGAFDSVDLAGSDDVRVVTGPQPSVVATGPASVLDRLDIRIEGNALRIGRKEGAWHIGWGPMHGATIIVTTPGIKAATLGGSGNMTVDRARGDLFEGALAGSGALSLADVAVARLALKVAGSGDLRAAGNAQDAKLSVGGSGSIAASGLVSQQADIGLSGSGDVVVGAQKSAKISMAGSGNVTVKGTGNCQISKTGSGDVRCTP